ncbi:hypothetical protein [Deinococcus sp. AJ005]|uniref:protein kinase domain-containing protein n=1 Tax=Deinococcus sp. AJ005 TaxID=2652443 RepID=UPI001865787A|nr:hypothetical protein [Deinococcus sp. AJ005]
MKVKDEGGRQHVLTGELGSGGQGVVYLTADDRYVVKVLRLSEAEARESWTRRLSSVLTLPLEDLRVTRPIRLLARPNVGYVMERVPGAQPLSTLSAIPHAAPSAVDWYRETGSLRRRLTVLARTAGVLSRLHARGMVYGDPSPTNVLFDEALNVHLIDADNLQYASRPSAQRILTPWFAAPEVYAGRSGVNTLTDAFAFAAMAFQALTLLHPLLGDQVSENSAEAEEAALRGEWPWVDHPADDRNRAQHGLPRAVVLTPTLRGLAQQTFGEGLLDVTRRPGLASWEEALWEAVDRLLRCPACGEDADHALPECPWCAAPQPGHVQVQVHVADSESEALAHTLGLPLPDRPVAPLICGPGLPCLVLPRHVTGQPEGQAHVELVFDGERLQVRSLDGRPYTLQRTQRDKDDVSVDPQARPKRFPLLPGRSAWELHLGELDGRHRYLTFDRVLEVSRAGA